MTRKSQTKKSKPFTKRASKPVKTVKSTQSTAPQDSLSEFGIKSGVDSAGIRITTTYQNYPIHVFTLPSSEYIKWITWNSQQQAAYVHSHTNAKAFANNAQLIHLVIQATVNTINSVMPRVLREKALQFTLH